MKGILASESRSIPHRELHEQIDTQEQQPALGLGHNSMYKMHDKIYSSTKYGLCTSINVIHYYSKNVNGKWAASINAILCSGQVVIMMRHIP